MHLRIVDPGGQGLGLALGLVELGHRVSYTRPDIWLRPDAPSLELATAAIAQHYCGPQVAPLAETVTDATVLVDCFADYLHALLVRDGVWEGFDAKQPFAATRNPLVYPARLEGYLDLAARVERLVVMDLADQFQPRETAFERLPEAVLLARESPRGGIGPWRAWPYLFSNALLVVERLREQHTWWVAPERRTPALDWIFAGTVDHARYGGQRQRAIAEVRTHWPTLQSRVVTDQSFFATVQLLQQARCGLDLPGVGQLCFRQHECLALGVPLFRPRGFTIECAPGISAAIAHDPHVAAAIPFEQVRHVYLESYSPRAAAQALLVAMKQKVAGGTRGAPVAVALRE